MPRQSRSSPSRSSSSTTARGRTATVPPPTAQSNQVARPGMGSGIMGSLMTGMAFGAGSELIRGLFRNTSVGGINFMPILLSGAAAFGANRFLFKNHQYRLPLTFAVFGATYLLTKNIGEEPSEYH